MKVATVPTAPLDIAEPLIVHRSVDGDGATYALDLRTRRRLKEHFGDAAHLPPRIYIAHETPEDSRRIHASIRERLVLLLTGLTEDALATLGEVQFRDAVTGEPLDAQSTRAPGPPASSGKSSGQRSR